MHGITGGVLVPEELSAAPEHHGSVLGVVTVGIDGHGQLTDEGVTPQPRKSAPAIFRGAVTRRGHHARVSARERAACSFLFTVK